MKNGVDHNKRLAEALTNSVMTGYSIETWRIKEKLIHWDAAFAMGFTSYSMLTKHEAKHQDEPLDLVREILLRLYLIEPQFPHLFVAPSITEVVDFLFNIQAGPGINLQDDRKRCASLLAPILGKDRGAGYRWLKDSSNIASPMSLSIRRLLAKIFSMDQVTARDYFWKVALIAAKARDMKTTVVEFELKKRGVLGD